MDIHQEERNELAEDEEKLQLALQEVANEDEDWYDYEDVDEEEDEDGLMIDLDAPSSTTGQSSSGYVESGLHGHFMTIDEDNQDGRGIPSINVPSQEKADVYTAEKTLALNQALQEILESRIESIQAAIEINREKQSRLNDGAWADLESKKTGKGRTWGPFRTPFFKSNEADSYPPDNEDTILKRKNNELHYDSMKEHMQYNTTNKVNLLRALVEDTKEALMTPVMNRLETEIKKATELRNCADEKGDDIQVLQKKWKALKHLQNEMMERKHVDGDDLEDNSNEMEEIKKDMAIEEEEYNKRLKLKQEQDLKVTEIEDELRQIRRMTNNEILQRVDTEKVDWMKLSKSWFKDSTSWVDCLKAWEFMANPQINLKPWRKEEETRLLELVEEHEAREWDVVAQELGTCRTPFHCFYHYQSRFNPEFKSRIWKKEEDNKLIEAVKRVRETSSNFTWGKVAALINSRSSVECSQRYSRVGDDRSFGRWSKEEDARLIMAVETLGFNWLKVSKFIGNRTVLQCKRRFTHCLNPELNFFHFTYDEDMKLLALYKQLGKQWVKIASHFKGRTDSMMKSRLEVLQKWRKETEWWESLDETSKNLLLGKNLTIEERKHFEGEWKSFYNMKLGVADKDYRRQEVDKERGFDPDIIPPRPPIHLKYSKFQRGFAERKNAVWSKRLNEHHLILENLRRNFQEVNPPEKKDKTSSSADDDRDINTIKTILKNNRLKDKELTDEEKRLSDMMNNTLEEVKMSHDKKVPPEKINQLLSALNLHFLGDSNVFVSDILKAAQGEQVNLKKEAHVQRRKLNLRIRRILAKNKWVFIKSRLQGRVPSMRALPVDNRHQEEMEKDSKDWDKGVPSVLMRRLGGDSQTLLRSIKERISTMEKKKKGLPHFEDDSEYKDQINATKRKLKEIRSLWHLPKQKREKLESGLNRKLKIIKRTFARAYRLKRELIDGEIEVESRDLECLQSSEKNNPLCQEEHNFQTCSASSSSGDKFSSADLSSSLFLSTAAQMLGDLNENESGNEEGNVTYGTIGFLPPSLTTLTALRALLLHRQQLMKTAGSLYKPEHYKRKKKHQLHIILDSDDEENDMEGAERNKTQRQPSIKAVEIIESENEENDNETNCNDSWFKSQSELPGNEASSIDMNLEKRGNLPSTSFAPYDRKNRRLMPDPSCTNRKNVTKDLIKFEDKVEDKKVYVPEESSKYEIMFGPSCHNINKTLDVNSDLKLTKHVYETSDKGEDKDMDSTTEVIDLSEENSSVEKPVEIVENVGKEKTTDDQDCRESKGETAEKNKLQQMVEGWKKSNAGDDMKNVVVVGLSEDKNEIIHYKADEVSKSANNSVQKVNSSINTKVSQRGLSSSTAKSNKGKCTVRFAPESSPHSKNQKVPETQKGPGNWEVQMLAANMPRYVNQMIEKRDQMADSNKVVVVGVDFNSGKVTHYKPGSQIEQPPPIAVRPPPRRPKTPTEMTETELKAYMAKIRETDEYQKMLTRFRALFMWPVLMSTTKPESEISLTETDSPPAPDQSKFKKPRGRPKMLKKEEVKIKKKKEKRKRKPVNESRPPQKRPRLDYAKILPKSERPLRIIKKPDLHSAPAPPTRYQKFKAPRIKRKAILPDWWKDAISEVMLKKREIEGGEDDNYEIDISNDEDFVDKGDYSDDEWLAELKEDERKKKEGETKGEASGGNEEEVEMIEEEEEEEVGKASLAMADDSAGDEGGNEDSVGDEDQEMKEAGSGDGENNDGPTFCIVGEDGSTQEVRVELID